MSMAYFVMKPTMSDSVAVKAKAGVAVACVERGVAVKSSTIVITLGIVFSCCCSILISPIQCISLSPVYWNLSNPIFKSSRNDHIISVNPFDEIDFVCPFYSVQQQQQQTSTDVTTATSSSQSENTEFYLIYQVSRSEYNECSIFSENNARLILSCSQPKHRRRFTIWFDPFQSVPKVPEYKSGHSYYFITPSTGQQNGLTNLYHGACFHHNMKLTIHIRDFISNEDDGPGHQPPSDYVSSRDVIGDAAEKQPTEADDVNHHHHHHHHPRRHQQQQQHPVLHQNNRSLSSSSSSSSFSSSSSVYSRRNLSRHLLPLMNSSQQQSPLPPQPTSAVADALQDKALGHLQVKDSVDTNRQLQQPTEHLRISQEQTKKSVFKSKQGLTVGGSSSSTASLLSAHLTHGLEFLFHSSCYLCCVTVPVVYMLSQSLAGLVK